MRLFVDLGIKDKLHDPERSRNSINMSCPKSRRPRNPSGQNHILAHMFFADFSAVQIAFHRTFSITSVNGVFALFAGFHVFQRNPLLFHFVLPNDDDPFDSSPVSQLSCGLQTSPAVIDIRGNACVSGVAIARSQKRM